MLESPLSRLNDDQFLSVNCVRDNYETEPTPKWSSVSNIGARYTEDLQYMLEEITLSLTRPNELFLN